LSATFAFDVYGTLIDVHSLLVELESLMGEKAGNFSQLWREKQLEYSFRRGLMKRYENFSVCTSQALDYACLQYKVNLAAQEKQTLLSTYSQLPVFDDVISTLSSLQTADCDLYAFSNGSAQAVDVLLGNASINDMFIDVVSADEISTFKPNPAVYEHFLERSKGNRASTWLISSNPFDVIGAISAGLNAAWLQRTNEQIFDPWDIEPTITINSLSEIKAKIVD